MFQSNMVSFGKSGNPVLASLAGAKITPAVSS